MTAANLKQDLQQAYRGFSRSKGLTGDLSGLPEVQDHGIGRIALRLQIVGRSGQLRRDTFEVSGYGKCAFRQYAPIQRTHRRRSISRSTCS